MEGVTRPADGARGRRDDRRHDARPVVRPAASCSGSAASTSSCCRTSRSASHPLTDRDAREMVREVRGSRCSRATAARPPGDVAGARGGAAARLAARRATTPSIAEMDLNPIKVLPPGPRLRGDRRAHRRAVAAARRASEAFVGRRSGAPRSTRRGRVAVRARAAGRGVAAARRCARRSSPTTSSSSTRSAAARSFAALRAPDPIGNFLRPVGRQLYFWVRGARGRRVGAGASTP